MKDQLELFEQYAIEVILGKKNNFKAKLLRLALGGLSYLFRSLVQTRLSLYRWRVLHQAHLGVTVVSIGNLTVGGTGKTPVVELFAKTLAERGRNVGVLSRGYKSKKKSAKSQQANTDIQLDLLTGKRQVRPAPRIVSNGKKLCLNVRSSGDEPWMLAKNLLSKQVKVIVDRDRVHCGDFAIRSFGTDTLLLDDGLQYLKLSHSIDIVLVDSTQPFGNGRLLPRGTLREPPENLRRADYIFLTKCDGSCTQTIQENLRKYNQHAPIIECTHKPICLVDLVTNETQDLKLLENSRVAAISGIAQPQSFERGLEKLGATVEIVARYADHHFYKPKEVEKFLDRAINRDVDFVLTTEKDAVRFPEIRDTDLPVYYLRIEIEILNGHQHWETCIQHISNGKHTLPTSSSAS